MPIGAIDATTTASLASRSLAMLIWKEQQGATGLINHFIPVIDESCHVAGLGGIYAAFQTAGSAWQLHPHHLHIAASIVIRHRKKINLL